MARSALTVQDVVITGLNPTLSAANVDGHSFANDGNTFLWVDNQDASSMNVTLVTPGKTGGVNIEDPVVAVPAGEARLIGPFDPRAFAQANGEVNVDFSSVTSLTVAAVSCRL